MKYFLSVALLATTMLILSSAASGSEQAVPKIKVAISGPKDIVLGTGYKYTLSVKNDSNVTLGLVKLHFSPAEMLAGASRPYKKLMVEWRPSHTAEWARSNFKPGAVFTVHVVVLTKAAQVAPTQQLLKSLVVDAYGSNPFAFDSTLFRRRWTSPAGGS